VVKNEYHFLNQPQVLIHEYSFIVEAQKIPLNYVNKSKQRVLIIYTHK